MTIWTATDRRAALKATKELQALAAELGHTVEYAPVVRKRGWPEKSSRPYRLIQRGRGNRCFATARALRSELLYLASLRAIERNFKALQTPEARANPGSPENWALYNAAIGKEA